MLNMVQESLQAVQELLVVVAYKHLCTYMYVTHTESIWQMWLRLYTW